MDAHIYVSWYHMHSPVCTHIYCWWHIDTHVNVYVCVLWPYTWIHSHTSYCGAHTYVLLVTSRCIYAHVPMSPCCHTCVSAGILSDWCHIQAYTNMYVLLVPCMEAYTHVHHAGIIYMCMYAHRSWCHRLVYVLLESFAWVYTHIIPTGVIHMCIYVCCLWCVHVCIHT